MKMVLKLSSVVLVCVGTLFMCVCTQSLSRDYGVKLCGREFIRAVIFTCGGSRWKRSLSEDLDAFHPRSYSDVNEGKDTTFNWPQSLDQAADHPFQVSSSSSLADLLLLGGGGDHRGPVINIDPSIELQDQASVFGGLGGPGESDRNWPRRDRHKRNFSLGVAGMCCNLGCTKNDIGRLC
ncbi:prorelaxin H1 [Esox lucius]|uniref:Insulin-like domain-containing protein n=1 Tax=Esox lucius TaxID=8010 RepID=A0A6Q2XVS6_ESOLU|nr:prorelaxin H1 [Esox lucius]